MVGISQMGTASAASLNFLQVSFGGDDTDQDGSIAVHVIGTDTVTDSEVQACQDALVTALGSAYSAENSSSVSPDIGINGYGVYGWNSSTTFSTSNACEAIEDSAEKLSGTSVEGESNVVAWLWNYDGSWAAGRGIGSPWEKGTDHQHPAFVDATSDETTDSMAFSAVHEVGHTLVYSTSGSANCDPAGYTTQTYEACSKARAETAPWHRGHVDHTLGTVHVADGTEKRTPMAHVGKGYAVGHCNYPQDYVPSDFTYELSDCAIRAMGHSWRHQVNHDGDHDDEDTLQPDGLSNFTVTDKGPNSISLSWSSVSDNGDAGLAYYGVDVWAPDVLPHVVLPATQQVPAGTTSVTLEGLEPETDYEIEITPVDGAGQTGSAAEDVVTTTSTGLLVNDYDGDPAWPGSNDLGEWNGAGGFENGGGEGAVVDGALRLDYDGGGWFKSEINRDVSAYSSLQLVVRADAAGADEEFSLSLGGVEDTLSNLTSDGIGTSYGTVAVDMGANGMSATSPGALELGFWDGQSADNAVEIDEIRFV